MTYTKSFREGKAGKVELFSKVFEKTMTEAALSAGVFHREEVPIETVKEHMRDEAIDTIAISLN